MSKNEHTNTRIRNCLRNSVGNKTANQLRLYPIRLPELGSIQSVFRHGFKRGTWIKRHTNEHGPDADDATL